tara:strand:- start:30075 stop:30581 length:507 start_codon:yes stop_codon:yes gene_type:complete
MPTFNRYLNGIIRAEHITADAVTTTKIANDAITSALTDASIAKTLTFEYNGVSKGAGAKTMTAVGGGAQTLPAGVLIKEFLIESTEAFTSDGSATIALGYTGTAAGIMAATAFDNAAIAIASVGWEHSATMGGAINGTSGAHSVLLTIATAAITAGHCKVHITYLETV